ncbi:MAG: DUF4430 domain-containing protein [Lachnospiraceae bacterium]|nr:DUF4430 domain-containing protein [Lachnospiraceae bacterium]
MKKTNVTKALSLILCTVLIAAMALVMTGCSDNKNQENPQTSAPAIQPGGAVPVLGEGENVFIFSVFDQDGKETAYEIHTNQTIVGEALQELGLLEGEEGAYGLYVTVVNGIRADYDKDGVYWAFYIDGEYAMSGVDVTEIEAGRSYAFKVEKA